MEPDQPRIVFSDHLDNGVVIGFDDGKMAFYPAKLLYATLPQAQRMTSDAEARDQPEGE